MVRVLAYTKHGIEIRRRDTEPVRGEQVDFGVGFLAGDHVPRQDFPEPGEPLLAEHVTREQGDAPLVGRGGDRQPDAAVLRFPMKFWLAVRIGAALLCGGYCLLFGLPGNPVSSYVTFELFVRPVIRRFRGEEHQALIRRFQELDEEWLVAGRRRLGSLIVSMTRSVSLPNRATMRAARFSNSRSSVVKSPVFLFND